MEVNIKLWLSFEPANSYVRENYVFKFRVEKSHILKEAAKFKELILNENKGYKFKDMEVTIE